MHLTSSHMKTKVKKKSRLLKVYYAASATKNYLQFGIGQDLLLIIRLPQTATCCIHSK